MLIFARRQSCTVVHVLELYGPPYGLRLFAERNRKCAAHLYWTEGECKQGVQTCVIATACCRRTHMLTRIFASKAKKRGIHKNTSTAVMASRISCSLHPVQCGLEYLLEYPLVHDKSRKPFFLRDHFVRDFGGSEICDILVETTM